jgi:hypothetical protein
MLVSGQRKQGGGGSGAAITEQGQRVPLGKLKVPPSKQHLGRVHPEERGRRRPHSAREAAVARTGGPTTESGGAGNGLRRRNTGGRADRSSPGQTLGTFQPKRLRSDGSEFEGGRRKRDPLWGRKLPVLGYAFYLVVFLLVSMGARPTEDIYAQNSVLENVLMLREDEEDSGIRQQQLGIFWTFITTEADFWTYMEQGLAPGLMGTELQPGKRMVSAVVPACRQR